MSDKPENKNPSNTIKIGVHPGIILLIALITPMALHFFIPLHFLESAMKLRLFVSGFLFFSAGGILWSSFRSLNKHKTTAEPTGIPRRLVCSGPFRFSRNPMYFAQPVLLAGAGFLLGSFWPFFAIPLMVLALHRCVIVPEERCLEKIFGQDYREYCKTVRRWI